MQIMCTNASHCTMAAWLSTPPVGTHLPHVRLWTFCQLVTPPPVGPVHGELMTAWILLEWIGGYVVLSIIIGCLVGRLCRGA